MSTDEAPVPATRFTPGSGPVQLVTRLLELTPELYAHYADAPSTTEPESEES